MKLGKLHLLLACVAPAFLASRVIFLDVPFRLPTKTRLSPMVLATAISLGISCAAAQEASSPTQTYKPALLGLRGALPTAVATPTPNTTTPKKNYPASDANINNSAPPALLPQIPSILSTPQSSSAASSAGNDGGKSDDVSATTAASTTAAVSSDNAQAPLPPRRPQDLDQLAAPNPASQPENTTALTAEASENETNLNTAVSISASTSAPLPAPRPPEFKNAATAPSSAQSVVEAAAQAASALTAPSPRGADPMLRPAPDDAFQQPPPKLGMGDPVFVRIFKQEGQLELWLKKNGKFHLFKTFPICKWSGRLGPKEKEADYQSPEGFYSVSARQLNPHSNYHRAFNVGYPNAFDRQNGRTGGLVMVHGACKSVGCFAMTDRGIEEIYGFVEAALRAGQKDIAVHIFPFKMTDANIARETGGGWLAFVGGPNYSQWNGFWRNLKQGYDLFEQNSEPPVAFACGDHYEFGSGPASCKKVAGW